MTQNTEFTAYQQMEGFDPAQVELLHLPLEAHLIEHRPGGGGRQLAYISAKTAIDTANRIFGFGKWGYRVVARSFEKATNPDGTCTGFFYTADVELYVIGCPFPFPGEGIGIVTPLKSGTVTPECHEKARKEAVTDAMKRALRHYGDQFGLVLYDQNALVDAGDGVLVAVKEVPAHHGSSPPPAKRTVEAGGSVPRQLPQGPHDAAQKPSEKALSEMIGRAKKRAVQAGLAHNGTEWAAILDYVGLTQIKSIAEVGKLNAYLTEVEQRGGLKIVK
ncbi:MAG: Rad52/Rad22 family DNA repair protein [Ktedonobacteraceae bacterium]